MRVTFIGSSHGLPEPNRKCSCAMLEVGGNVYYVDMGVSPMDSLVTRNIPMESVKAAFFTHMHGDHTDGLINFVDLASWYYQTCSPEFYLPKVECVDVIRDWLKLTNVDMREDLVFKQTTLGEIYDDGVIKVTARRSLHADPAFSYKIEAEGKSVLFTGDLSNPKNEFPDTLNGEDYDLVICECAHFNAMDYLDAYSTGKIKKVVFNHYSPWHIGEIYQLRKELKEIVPVLLATDDYQVEV